MSKNSDVGTRLAQLTLMLSSDQQGEVASAAAAIGRTLRSIGHDWHALAKVIANGFGSQRKAAHEPAPRRRRSKSRRPAPSYQAPDTPFQKAASKILRVGQERLTVPEKEFLMTLLHWDGRPTEKQLRWLHSLCQRFSVEVEGG